MKKIFYLLSTVVLLAFTGCSKQFLEDMKPYNDYGENQVFSNEELTSWYIARLYNYYFSDYNNPLKTVVGLYNNDRSNMTEEIGGTIPKYIDANRDLQFANDADSYYGQTSSSVKNNPYTRIRYCSDLIEKMGDPVSAALSADFKKTAKGQAYFLRALQYFDLVRIYGGVPIVTTVQNNSTTDVSIQTPRSTSSECFAQIVSDLDSAAMLLPMIWDEPSTNYGKFTAAAALAMKSRVLLTAASPLFNKDWDNPASKKWQDALKAGLDAETKLSSAGYGLYGSSAKDWSEMSLQGNTDFNKGAIMVFLFSTETSESSAYGNGWEDQLRPTGYGGSGGLSATKQMLDLFPLANGKRPTAENGYVDTFFFENRDPRFYRTFEFSGEKWGVKGNENKSTWFYRWYDDKGKINYYGGNQTNSPAIVRKNSDPEADSTGYEFSGTNIIAYRYAELLLNIAECYAATGDINNAVKYIGKIRARVGIPEDNNYGVGNLSTKYQAIEAVLYERRVELAYEGKRFWDVQRWMLYDNTAKSGNTVTKLGLKPINGTAREGYYWQAKGDPQADPLTPEERNILIDPDAADFKEQLDKLKAIYQAHFVMTPLDKPWDQVNGNANLIEFKPNYYISGLPSSVLGMNSWLEQTEGWMDYSGAPGTFDYQK
ncbi:RagB/SusD family nutrient uptake outer membrane protein [Arachidicoccus terrestris]|uniref:RagB/SusD family nutrient uptake outer membrane protein n=1 Tax=Arachidicoccus terrestris TaxID=2875539 RepID=UPI001CC5C7C0|nr:RagB/SusD family nutrient uptake outer membrane protein [Arachidicoccus terrestris]UAY56207.1 RagB/SusD family nutrient uptake outer membrane protein [Arachidicoccus terrestris]